MIWEGKNSRNHNLNRVHICIRINNPENREYHSSRRERGKLILKDQQDEEREERKEPLFCLQNNKGTEEVQWFNQKQEIEERIVIDWTKQQLWSFWCGSQITNITSLTTNAFFSFWQLASSTASFSNKRPHIFLSFIRSNNRKAKLAVSRCFVSYVAWC